MPRLPADFRAATLPGRRAHRAEGTPWAATDTNTMNAEQWNLRFPVGVEVYLEDDLGEIEETRTRSIAWRTPSGANLAKVVGRSGGYKLDRLTPKPTTHSSLTADLGASLLELRHRRDRHAWEESTRDPIFLFQKRIWHLVGCPPDHSIDDEGRVMNVHTGVEASNEELASMEALSYEIDHPCVIAEWYTELVFLSRDEANAYGRAKHYNYSDGWRVFCVPAHASLAKMLKPIYNPNWERDYASPAAATP